MRLALAGDTMLGRGVAAELERNPEHEVVAAEVGEVADEADLFVLNLECCISDRGRPWPDPRKPFFFRAPPVAIEHLARLGVGCVTLANNHALDYGAAALLDTLRHLDAAGIPRAGAGRDVREAREPRVVQAGGVRLAVVAASDHPSAFAAGVDSPGIAFADLHGAGVPEWLRSAAALPAAGDGTPLDVEAVLVAPHWGPNMTEGPVAHVRTAAADLVDAGAMLVAGHSAHVFHGVAGRVLYDLGDFVDDYRVDPVLRNDLGLLWLVDVEAAVPIGVAPRPARIAAAPRLTRIEAVPLKLDYCHTRLAGADDADWIARRLERACAELGTGVDLEGGRLVVEAS